MSAVTTASPWDHRKPRFPPLDRDVDVDVAVVGGGITGITAAWLLKQAGHRVALIERARIVGGDTGHTTAHVTCVTDTRLHELARHFGEDGARAAWEAGAAAIDQIEDIVRATGADCHFRRVDGFLHVPAHGDDARDEDVRRLKEDAALAERFGFDATFVDRVPGHEMPGVRFANQAAFDPGLYLATLASLIPGGGSHVFEDTALESVETEPRRVKAAGGREIRCGFVVIATHNPLGGSVGPLRSALFQTKIALYTTYVLGARVPPGMVPDALFWDTRDPYDYVRIEPRADHELVIFGGADEKTGQGNDAEAFAGLERRLAERIPAATVTHRWLGQVIETDDGLPYIGEHSRGEFIATGFAGNGMTFGTIAAMMASDAYRGTVNPWADLFRVDRKPFHGGLWQYVRENLDYPWYLLRDRLSRADVRRVEDVPAGEGRIVALEEGRCAVYRDETGELSLCSAVCTHLKCLVRWNAADRTWDCPCHGSRFSPQGEVLAGPAEEPLRRIRPA